jgi:hypothetical protein
MSDESQQFMEVPPALRERPLLQPSPSIVREAPIFKRMLADIPPSREEEHQMTASEVGAIANGNAVKRSEARRDAVLAVALAIVRRGGNPVSDWTTKDVETSYSIADMLIALGSA